MGEVSAKSVIHNKNVHYRFLIFGCVGALLSGAAILAGLPPQSQGSLAWLALVPILLAYGLPAKAGHRLRIGFAFGMVMGLVQYGGSLWWISHVTVPGTMVLVLYLSLYSGIWLVGHAWLARQLREPRSIHHLALAAWSASLWAVLEWIRGWLFSGFGWNGLAMTQHDALPVLHFVSWGGLGLITWVIVFVNVVLTCVIHRFWLEMKSGRGVRRHADFYIVVVLLMVMFVFGLKASLEQRELNRGPLRLASIQANIPQSEKYQPDATEVVKRHVQLSETAIAMNPDLLLWPETATGRVYKRDFNLQQAVRSLMEKGDFTFAFGTLDRDDKNYFNTVFCLTSGSPSELIYRKQHLVPFGEYAPGAEWFPLMRKLVPFVIDFKPGSEPAVFTVKKGGWKFTPLICFEDTVPSLVRKSVRDGVELLVNFTNDAWFLDSPGAAQHWANAKCRALELDMPLIRATNSGISGIIGQSGRTEAMLTESGKSVEVEGILFTEFRWSTPRITLYRQWGDWPVGVSCMILLFGWAFARYGLRPKDKS